MRERTFTDAAREGLAEEMAKDPTIFVVGEGSGARGGNFNTTTGLYDIHGAERVRDVPICERGFVGMCAGAAMTGTRPVVDFMFTDFILDSIGEIVNQAAKMQYMSSGRLKMPLTLRGCVGVGGSAATHHSGNYYPFFTHQPGCRVALPSNPADAKGLLKTAIRSDDPVFFLEHRLLLNTRGPVPEEEYYTSFGEAAISRQGSDVTVVAIALMVPRTLEVCEQLEAEGISVEVVDPRTVAPLDMDTILESVHKTGRLLIVDDTYAPCAIGSEIAARIVDQGFDALDAPVRRLNGLHTPIPYSPPLEAATVPQSESIAAAIRDLMAE
jgi:2-oxoisovalerate dehydrogenase E1 component